MSTILKALRRLEHEKKRTDRPLREQVTGPGGDRGDLRPQRRWPVLLGGIGAGVFAGLAVLLLVLSRGDPPQETAPAAVPPEARAAASPAPAAPPVEPRRRRRRAAAQAAAAGPGASVPAAQPAGLDPDASEPAANETAPVRQGPSEGLAQGSAPLEDVAVIDRGDVGPREIAEAVPAAEGEPAAPKPGSVRPLHRGDPAGLPGSHLLPEGSEPPVAEPEARASAQMPVPEPVPAPVPVPARAPAPPLPRPEPARAADPAPRVAEPTPAVPRAEPAPAPRASSARPPAPAFPALRVEQTTWHPLAERRVAVIEVPGSGAQSVHEGDLVAGALVERIEPSAVVFEHAGREVRRKVGIAQ